MHTVVIYDSKFGNTEKIAEAIARGVATVGSVHVVDLTEAEEPLAEGPDLLLVGGPTQRRNMSPDLREFVGGLPAASLAGVSTSAFDTRYRGSTLLMGSAGKEAAKVLTKAGGEFVAPPESFFIGRGGPLERQTLEVGEVDRAEAWGRAVGSAALRERTAP